MKLARIYHQRCDSIDGTSYVWVADDVTEDQLDDLMDKAEKSYLAAEAAFKNNPNAPVQPSYPQLDRLRDDLTVGQAKAEYGRQKKAYEDYQKIVREAREPFTTHLVKVSEGKVLRFEDINPAIKVTQYWGHRHGVTIDYGETNISGMDFGPRREDDED